MPDKNKKVVSNRDCLGRRKGWWLDKGGLVVQGQQKLTLDLLCTRSLKTISSTESIALLESVKNFAKSSGK